jgi:uncharacterized protein involved in type VI secretion and phage assembly
MKYICQAFSIDIVKYICHTVFGGANMADFNYQVYQKKANPRKPRTYRLEESDIAYIEAKAVETGLSHTGVIVMALRALAKAEKEQAGE